METESKLADSTQGENVTVGESTASNEVVADATSSGTERQAEKTACKDSHGLKQSVKNSSQSSIEKKSETKAPSIKTDTKPEKTQTSQRETSSIKAPVLPYHEPSWGARPPDNLYSIEVIKNGCVKSKTVLEKKSYFVFGRLPSCDVVIDHPSSSRYHAILQYRGISDDKHASGYYLWDLASTHGTFINKKQIKSNMYIRIRTGFVLKFGGSSRLYIFQGPDEDQEEEGKIVKRSEIKSKDETSSGEDENSSEGISWGMGEDAVEEEVDLKTILKRKKPLELKDPKKTLRGFFEREGLDLEYGVEEQGSGNTKVYLTRVSLPIDTSTGEEVFAEGRASNKKQSVLMCATDACRILDAYDMLRSVQHESETAKRVKQLADNDFYDSDDDSFTDRTGQVEKKRLSRIARFSKKSEEVLLTFESLTEKLKEIEHSLSQLKAVLAKSENAEKDDEGKDSLDAFMSNLDAKIDKKIKYETKRKITQLEKDKKETLRLIEIARPTNMPELINRISAEETEKSDVAEKNLKSANMLTSESKDGNMKCVEKKIELKDTNVSDVSSSSTPSIKTDAETMPVTNQDPHTDSTTSNENKEAKLNTDFKIPTTLPISAKSTSDTKKRKAVPANFGIQHLSTEDKNAKKKKKKKLPLGPSWKSPSDGKFADWTPPQGQTGDGRTSLNEKFGY